MKIGTIVAAIVGAIVMFGLGSLFFAVLFSDYFRGNAIQYTGLEKDPPVIWAIFLFNLVWAWLIAYVLEFAGRTGWAEGAKAGAIVMFVLAVGISIEFFAFMNLHKEVAPVIAQILLVTFMGTVTGAVIGFVGSLFNRQATEA